MRLLIEKRKLIKVAIEKNCREIEMISFEYQLFRMKMEDGGEDDRDDNEG